MRRSLFKPCTAQILAIIFLQFSSQSTLQHPRLELSASSTGISSAPCVFTTSALDTWACNGPPQPRGWGEGHQIERDRLYRRLNNTDHAEKQAT